MKRDPLVEKIFQDVCELPGDADPADPNYVCLTTEDLSVIIERAVDGLGRSREAQLMVAIEKLAAIISDETPDDLSPSEVDDRRYRRAKPILKTIGMTIDGDAEVIGWGFDWPAELAEAERQARASLAAVSAG